MTVTKGDKEMTFYEFPAVLEVDTPGTYTLTQRDVFNNSTEITEKIYVSIPTIESNICYVGDKLPELYGYKQVTFGEFYSYREDD